MKSSQLQMRHKTIEPLLKTLKSVDNLRRSIRNKLQGHYKYRNYLDKFFWPKRIQQNFTKYSIVTAAYNAEPYLNTYFKSLTSQSLNFKKNIQLVMVDDGSTDNTGAIICRWQKKFPDNIVYIRQDNKGPASARNAGLPFATNPWVAMIDSDDFIHPDYFWHVNRLLSAHAKLNTKLLVCRLIHYSETKIKFNADHRFSFQFQKDADLCPCSNLGENIHFSACTAFFSLKEIQRQNLQFSTKVYPLFEDGHFVLRYLKGCLDGIAIFSKTPLYYYRQRRDSSSVVNSGWLKKEVFLDVLRYGSLDILKQYATTTGSAPYFVQRAVLIELASRVKSLVDGAIPQNLLTTEEQAESLSLCKEIFSYIDEATVWGFSEDLLGWDDFYKLGALYCFKGVQRESARVHCDGYTDKNKTIKLRYYGACVDSHRILFFNGKPLEPITTKTISRKIFDQIFLYESHCSYTLPLSSMEQDPKLQVSTDVTVPGKNKFVQIDIGGRLFDSVRFSELKQILG